MNDLLQREFLNNNFIDRLAAIEKTLAEIQALFSDKVFVPPPGETGSSKRFYTDSWISLGWPTANVEKLHVYNGNAKIEGNGFEDVTGGTLYLQNKPSLKGASPADNDVAGLIRALGVNDALNPIIIADVYFQISDVTEGSEDGNVHFVTQKDGADAFIFSLVSDRVGVNNLSPSYTLDVNGQIRANVSGSTGIIAGSGSGSSSIVINGAAGTARNLNFQTGGVGRWVMRADGAAETGSEVGSDLLIQARLDDGNFGPNLIRGRRSDGAVLIGIPTGGYKGAGTINAQAVYDDNTLLTPYVLEAALTNDVNLAELDNKVPNRTIPAKMRVVPAVTRTVKGERNPKTRERLPDTVEIVTPEREEIVEPEREEIRTHAPARRFVANMATELDPRAFAAKWKNEGRLPAFPSDSEWAAQGNFSTGDLIQRLMETVEVQAVHIDKLLTEIDALTDRVTTLEQ